MLPVSSEPVSVPQFIARAFQAAMAGHGHWTGSDEQNVISSTIGPSRWLLSMGFSEGQPWDLVQSIYLLAKKFNWHEFFLSRHKVPHMYRKNGSGQL
jgi:hypothetical protein